MFVGFYYPGVPPSVKVLVRHSEIVNAFSFSWSAATNVWATAMIAYKAWFVPSLLVCAAITQHPTRPWQVATPKH